MKNDKKYAYERQQSKITDQQIQCTVRNEKEYKHPYDSMGVTNKVKQQALSSSARWLLNLKEHLELRHKKYKQQ